MANFLSGLGQGIGTVFGGAGNAGAASSNAWNYGQYSPFTVNNPMGSVGWNGTQGTSSFSPQQQGLNSQFNSSIMGGLQGQYNPNTSFLPQQYQQIFGPQFQNNVNTQFQHLQQAQAPWIQQGNAQNLDSEYSKGTLGATAGSYQTAGHDMANNALTQQNYGQAFQQANQLGANQFGAAQGVAGLGEQQAQFGPQFGLAQGQQGLLGMNNQNQFLQQMMQLGGNLGAQRSGANVSAAIPGIETGNIQDNATAGFLGNLLMGNGTTSGLLTGLLGGGGGNGGGGGSGGLIGQLGGLIGKGVGAFGSLFGGGGGGGGYTNPGTGGTGWAGDTQSSFNDSGGSGSSSDSGGTTSWWGDFNGAGGQAANPALQNIGVGNVSTLPSVQGAVNRGYTGGQGLGLGDAQAITSTIQGLLSGRPEGYLSAAANLGQLGAKVTGNKALGGYSGTLGNALGVYGGLQQGGVGGYSQAALSGAQLGARAGAFGGSSAAIGAAAAGVGSVLGAASIPLIWSAPAEAENNAGNKTMNSWMHDTGVTTKVVNPPTSAQQTATSQGGFSAVGSGYTPKSVFFDPSGNPMSNAQASLSMAQYAGATGKPLGNLASAATAQQAINTGGYGSQIFAPPAPVGITKPKIKPLGSFGG